MFEFILRLDRDNKILQNDLISKKKNNANLIHHLSRNMINARKEMENAVAGDKQNLRNILQEHKDLLLAFNRLTPEVKRYLVNSFY